MRVPAVPLAVGDIKPAHEPDVADLPFQPPPPMGLDHLGPGRHDQVGTLSAGHPGMVGDGWRDQPRTVASTDMPVDALIVPLSPPGPDYGATDRVEQTATRRDIRDMRHTIADDDANTGRPRTP